MYSNVKPRTEGNGPIGIHNYALQVVLKTVADANKRLSLPKHPDTDEPCKHGIGCDCSLCTCHGLYRKATDLPCVHRIMAIIEAGGYLFKSDLDIHWYIDREAGEEPDVLHEFSRRKRQRLNVDNGHSASNTSHRAIIRSEISDANASSNAKAKAPVRTHDSLLPGFVPTQKQLKQMAPDGIFCQCQTNCQSGRCKCSSAIPPRKCGVWCHKGKATCENLESPTENALQNTDRFEQIESQLARITQMMASQQEHAAQRGQYHLRQQEQLQMQQRQQWQGFPHQSTTSHPMGPPIQPMSSSQQQYHVDDSYVHASNPTRMRQKFGQLLMG
ncbi:hypothetical protein K3495_g3917 [Podosphaera aphanis]|nr:hypothetical protein K3495_g3917 [Podosphaera aphanis]